VQMYRYIF